MNIENDLLDMNLALNGVNKELKEKNLELYKEIERLNNIIDKIHKYCKENQVVDRLELLCIIKEDKINELYDKVKDLDI